MFLIIIITYYYRMTMNMNMYIIIILLCIAITLWLLRPINDNFVVASTTSPAVKIYTMDGTPIEFPVGEYITLKQITDLGLTNGKTNKIVVPEGFVISVWLGENMYSYDFSRSFGPGEYDVDLTINSMSVIAEDISNMVQIQEPDITITTEGWKYLFLSSGEVIVIPAGITITVYNTAYTPTIYSEAGEYTIDVYMSWATIHTSAAPTAEPGWSVTIKPNKMIIPPNELIHFQTQIPINSNISVPVNHTVLISDKSSSNESSVTNTNAIYKTQETYTISTEISSIMAVLTSDAIILTDTNNNNQLYSYNNITTKNSKWNLDFTIQKLVVPDNILVKIHNANSYNSDADFTSGTHTALNLVTKHIKIEKFNYETAIILTDANNNEKFLSYNNNKDDVGANINIQINKPIQKLVVPDNILVKIYDVDNNNTSDFTSGTYEALNFNVNTTIAISQISSDYLDKAIILTDANNNKNILSYNKDDYWANSNIQINKLIKKLVVPDNILVKIYDVDNDNTSDFTSGTYEALNFNVNTTIAISQISSDYLDKAIILTDANNNKNILSYNKDDYWANINISINKPIKKLVVPNEYAVLFNDNDLSIKKIYISGTYTEFDFPPGEIELYKTSPCGSAAQAEPVAPAAPAVTAASCIISGDEKVSFEKLEGVISNYYDAL
jgi:hypothetical protein